MSATSQNTRSGEESTYNEILIPLVVHQVERSKREHSPALSVHEGAV